MISTHNLSLMTITGCIVFSAMAVYNAFSYESYQSYYNEGYSYGYNFVKQYGNIPADASGNGSCSANRAGYSDRTDAGEAYIQGCWAGRRDAAANLPASMPPATEQMTPAQMEEHYQIAYKHCTTNYFSRNIYETECCAKIINDERVKQGDLVDFQKIIWDASKRPDMKTCVSEPKVVQFGSNKSYELIEVEIGHKYTKEQAEQISHCTGNALANKYMPNPVLSMKYINNIFQDEWSACLKNSSYTTTSGSVNQPSSPAEQESAPPSEPQPSVNDAVKQTNETMKEINSTINELKNIKNIFD